MSETKTCPFCGEEILAVAIKCKHCGSDLSEKESSKVQLTKAGYGVFLLGIPLVSTLLILFWVGSMNLLQSPGGSMTLIMIGTVVGTAIVAALEAIKFDMVSDKKKGAYSPTAWFFIICFLWIIGYPAYLFKRRHYGLPNRLVSGIVVALVFLGTFFVMDTAIESKKAEVLGAFGIAEKNSGGIKYPGMEIIQDYKIMGRVSEAAASAGATRTAIDIAWSEGMLVGPTGNIPTKPESLGLDSPENYRNKYVKAVTYNAQGVVTVILRDTSELGPASGKTIVFEPVVTGNNNLDWRISDSSSIPRRFYPRR